jgi:hypothetical protein
MVSQTDIENLGVNVINCIAYDASWHCLKIHGSKELVLLPAAKIHTHKMKPAENI